MTRKEIEKYKKLVEKLNRENLPTHVGLIMDGNGRWAKSRNLPRTEGHKEGLKTLERILDFNLVLGIKYLTIYAFSTENWKRDRGEVETLLDIAMNTIEKKMDYLSSKGVRFIHLGEFGDLPEALVSKIKTLEEVTMNGNIYTLCAAFNYGGRQEIVSAVKNIIDEVEKGNIRKEEISSDVISRYIYKPEVPDVDLIIRTSGEKRLSNFMLWRSSYSELYFVDKLWPDFTPEDFVKALVDYQNRKRKFGGC